MSDSILPPPLVWTTLRPVQTNSQKVRAALATLAESDPTFRVEDEDADGQVVISGMGPLHLEIICDRLAREYNIYVEAGAPSIIYLETIRETSEAEGTFVSQSAGHGHYARVKIRIEPNPGRGYELVHELPQGAIPKKYLDGVVRGVRYALKAGVVAGYEIVDVKVILSDGSYHETDSDEEAFESAAFMALKQAAAWANPVLLEPLMSVQVVVPDEFLGAVIGDLNSRRGRIDAMEHRDERQLIQAIVPLAEMMDYATELRSHTLGRASFSSAFAKYEQAPNVPPVGDDRVGVTANKPWKPKPKRGAEVVQPPQWDSDC